MPTSCVLLSLFYNETIIAYPTCTCGCQNNVTHPGSCVNHILLQLLIPWTLNVLIPNYELREDFIRLNSLNMGPPHTAEPWKRKSGLFNNNQFVMIDQTTTKSTIIDIQACCPNLTRFSYKFPGSGIKQAKKDGLDMLSLCNLTGLTTVTTTDYMSFYHDMGSERLVVIYDITY
nr:hypothetical protein [Tanacetum cinerariifolium]